MSDVLTLKQLSFKKTERIGKRFVLLLFVF